MPRPAAPDSPEYFVYTFVANDYPFYVGIGRAARASDRIRYVRYLLKRQQDGKSVKWVNSNRVIAALLHRGIIPELQYDQSNMTRAEALQREHEVIAQLCVEGRLLANLQQNVRKSTVDEIVEAIIRCEQ